MATRCVYQDHQNQDYVDHLGQAYEIPAGAKDEYGNDLCPVNILPPLDQPSDGFPTPINTVPIKKGKPAKVRRLKDIICDEDEDSEECKRLKRLCKQNEVAAELALLLLLS